MFVPGSQYLASDEEREPSFLALQAAFMVWVTRAR